MALGSKSNLKAAATRHSIILLSLWPSEDDHYLYVVLYCSWTKQGLLLAIAELLYSSPRAVTIALQLSLCLTELLPKLEWLLAARLGPAGEDQKQYSGI